MLTERKHITRAMLQAEPDTLFVFGDNMARRGYGGQAREMRDEPNAVGIPTKWRPSMDEKSFFHDSDLPLVRRTIDEAFMRLRLQMERGGNVVWPADGIGTGLANLVARAPAIAAYIAAARLALHPSTQGDETATVQPDSNQGREASDADRN